MSGTMGPRENQRLLSSLLLDAHRRAGAWKVRDGWVGTGSDDVILDVDIFGDVRHTYLVWNSIHLPWVLLGT